MSDIQSLALQAQDLGQSADWWNSAMIWALVFAAIAAIAVVVTTHNALKRAKQLGDAQEKLMDLKIAEANERAANANLALAKFKQPRILTPEQQDRIVSKLKAFPNQRFAAYVFSDQESIDLANTLGRILYRAQWVVQSPNSDIAIGKLGISVLSGVRVEVAPSHAAQLRAIADRLASALSAEGIPCKTMEVPEREKSPDAIHIVIGKKPTQ